MDGDYHGQRWTIGFCGKEVFNHQIFIIGYLQFVERRHLHAALVQLGIELQHRQLSTSIFATSLKNCSVKPSEAPKEMAVMYKYNPGGEYIEVAVV
jgi:hypothetical protein